MEFPDLSPLVVELLEAENEYGAGFYCDDRWLAAQTALAAMIGWEFDQEALKWRPLQTTESTK